MSHELGCQSSVSLAVTLLQLQRVREEICLLLGWWDQPGHQWWDISQLDTVLGLQSQQHNKSASRAVKRTLLLM